jgi:hypothetical protein
MYVNPESDEFEYLDFFINSAMIGSRCVDLLLDSAGLLSFSREQASEGKIRAQRSVRWWF